MTVATRTARGHHDPLSAEVHAFNQAFHELELSWHWDEALLRQLQAAAGDGDCVSLYVERCQPHLLRVYDKHFLRDLVLAAKSRYQSH
jgi:hypothetical protein